MLCKKCGETIDEDSKFCQYCGQSSDINMEDIVNDYIEKLGIDIKKDDRNNEHAENKYHINNLSIDIESKLADINEKMLSLLSNNIDTSIRDFKNLINEKIGSLEYSFNNELKEFGNYINGEIEQKNIEIEIKNKEIEEKQKNIEEERKRILVEKMELFSNLLAWKNKKDAEFKQIQKDLQEEFNQREKGLQEEFDQKQRDLQEEFDQKQRDLGNKQLEVGQSIKEFDDRKRREEKKIEQSIKEFDQKLTAFEQMQKEFNEQVTTFKKEKKDFDQKKIIAIIIITILFIIAIIISFYK